MKKYDYHVHGTYSSDSSLSYSELIGKAVTEGYTQIAFTDHFDYLPSEAIEYGIPSYVEYINSIERIQALHKESISILAGVEIGEFHRVNAYTLPMLQHRKPDLIIGSIHVLPDGFNVSVPFNETMSKKQIIDYYTENLAMVEESPINILGHLGIHKRYMTETPDETYAETIVDKILDIIIKRDIALEVNYSPFRKPYGKFLAEPSVVYRYLEKGGRLITIGSDSHSIDNFNDYYNKTIEELIDCNCHEIAVITPRGWETSPISEK
jgi:histidinol-phosphatase (PHP family)